MDSVQTDSEQQNRQPVDSERTVSGQRTDRQPVDSERTDSQWTANGQTASGQQTDRQPVDSRTDKQPVDSRIDSQWTAGQTASGQRTDRQPVDNERTDSQWTAGRACSRGMSLFHSFQLECACIFTNSFTVHTMYNCTCTLMKHSLPFSFDGFTQHYYRAATNESGRSTK